jgi:hypothetical protein
MQSWTASLDAFFASMFGATLDERIHFCSSVANALTRLKACKHFASLTSQIYKGILLLDMDGLHLMGRMSSKSFSCIIPEHDFVLCIAAPVLPFIRIECAFETNLVVLLLAVVQVFVVVQQLWLVGVLWQVLICVVVVPLLLVVTVS